MTLAGEHGYRTLINETLQQVVQGDELEERLRRIIRKEMHRVAGVAPAAT